MRYLYEEFEVETQKKSYVVTRNIPGEEETKIRISKELVEKVNTSDDKEMVAIVCAIFNFIRLDAKQFDKKAEKTILTATDFPERLSSFLNTRCIEEAIEELLEMKYHEVKEMFS